MLCQHIGKGGPATQERRVSPAFSGVLGRNPAMNQNVCNLKRANKACPAFPIAVVLNPIRVLRYA